MTTPAPWAHRTDQHAEQCDPGGCDCWADGEAEPVDHDHLAQLFLPPWITVTPRSEYL